MTFLLLAALGVLMALIYLPLRIYLTLTARGRRLRLLQRIRSLRQQLGEELTRLSSLAGHHHAAVDLQHLAGDVGRGWISCQKAHGTSHLVDFAVAA